mgnify:CR=1 FL=1
MSDSRDFQVKFWGVRGSIPSPGPETARYGGNTTCIEVRAGDTVLAIDGGTGVRNFGESLRQSPSVEVAFLMTHLHWDHVQGFPFFAPFLNPNNRFRILSAHHKGGNIHGVLKQLMAQPAFPISMEAFRSDMSFEFLEFGDTLQFGDVTVRTMLLNHPGDVVGYRFEYDGKVYVHASDWEHPAEGALDGPFVEFMRGADLLSIDATYTEDEYHGRSGPARVGWGHATHDACIRHARAANVGHIVLTHHEPARSDDELDGLKAGRYAADDDVSFAVERGLITL